MKRTFAVVFLIALSLPTAYKIGLFAFFQLNRTYIAENYCVNKDRPMTMCYGKCFLERGMQLVDKNASSDSFVNSVSTDFSEYEAVDFYLISVVPTIYSSYSFLPRYPLLTGVTTSLFRPPLV